MRSTEFRYSLLLASLFQCFGRFVFFVFFVFISTCNWRAQQFIVISGHGCLKKCFFLFGAATKKPLSLLTLNKFWMDCTALQPLEIARFKTWDLQWTYLALGYFSATLACTPFLLELAPSYPWPTRPDIIKPHSCSVCNKVSTIVWVSNFSSLTNPINSSQT